MLEKSSHIATDDVEWELVAQRIIEFLTDFCGYGRIRFAKCLCGWGNTKRIQGGLYTFLSSSLKE